MRTRLGVSKAGASASAVLLAALLHANPASADLFTSFGGGVFVGYGGGDFMWGLEALATQENDDNSDCQNNPRSAYGPLARFSLHGLSRPSFTLTGFAGQEVERAVLGFGLEAGATLGFPNGLNRGAKGSLHTGLFGEAVIFNASFWQEWMLNEYPVAVGARLMPTFGVPGFCAIGRPQRDARGQRVWTPAPLAARSSGACNLRDELAADWLDNAREEYESVPAFLQLAQELAALGAPSQLVQRAQGAALEELEHTELCLELASDAGSIPTLPIPHVVRREALIGQAGLRRLALESWLDGCLGEGLAARLAADESRSHSVASVRRAQARIAQDEQSHAELAWDILRWCVESEPSVKGLLEASREARVLPSEVRVGDAHQRAQLAERHHRVCQQRLHALCA